MSEPSPEEIRRTVTGDANTHADAAAPARGMSPYATGGGGVTFERRVAVQYLAHMLDGDGASELGDDRRVVSVAFQQAPAHSVDDLVVYAERPSDLQPSLVLALAVRRSPRLVPSNEQTRAIIRQFVDASTNAPTGGPEYRFGLVVAGPQPHAEQLVRLADVAQDQMDASGFFELVRTPGKFQAVLRDRLQHIAALVQLALHDLGVANPDTTLIQQRTWELLSRLDVRMPRLESPTRRIGRASQTAWSR